MDDRTTTMRPAEDDRFDRLAGACALAAAALSLIYAISFVVLKTPGLSAAALAAGGLLSAVALFAVYQRIKSAGSLAALGLVLGLAGVVGAAIHGAFDLANVMHPEVASALGANPVDPRGFLTFGVSGLGVLILSWAGLTVARLPRRLLYLGLLLGVLLVLIYLGRLIILDANNVLVLAPAALAGVIVSPLWYGWVGWLLLKGRT
jgi:hypothetical protein